MNVLNFDSHEQMQDYLAAARKQAHLGLHQSQRDLTFGDYWVRFVDLDAQPKIVEFGYIYSERTTICLAMSYADNYTQGADDYLAIRDSLDNGYMYGRAFSLLGPDGEEGTTHKAHVWPIEERLFRMAEEVDWNIDRLDDTGRILLEMAFRGQRAHVRSQA